MDKKVIQVIITLILIGAVVFVFYDFYDKSNKQKEFDEAISQEEMYDDGNKVEYGAHVGDKVYDYELTDMKTGETIKISDFHGKKVYMFFWASWCPHCQNTASELQELHEDRDELVIIGVNLHRFEQSEEEPFKFVEDLDLTYINVLAQDEMFDTFLIQSTPTSLFINSQGVIEEGVVGGLTREVIESRFEDVN